MTLTAAIPTIIYLYPLNTQAIQITGLQDETTGIYLSSATVSATLLDDRGNADAVLNNIPLAFTGPNGNYLGTVPDSFNPRLGSGYTLQIKADSGGVQALWSIPVQVKLRAQ